MDTVVEIEKVNVDQLDKVLLYDGVCVFCNNSVDFILNNEKNPELRFVPLQSNLGEKILAHFGYPLDYLGSILFLTEGRLLAKSSAALVVSKYLKFPLSFLQVFRIVPAFMRDWIYDFIANNRYKWFGKYDTCRIPTPDLRKRFLE